MTSRPVVAVGAVIIRDDHLLLVERARPPGEGLWAVPGGQVKLGEDMAAAVRREVLEETGLRVEVGDVVWVGDSIGPGVPPAWHYTITQAPQRLGAKRVFNKNLLSFRQSSRFCKTFGTNL